MNELVIGKRIPIGAVVNGIVFLAAWYYNQGLPIEAQIPALIIGGLSTSITAVAQTIVVNYFGVTTQ